MIKTKGLVWKAVLILFIAGIFYAYFAGKSNAVLAVDSYSKDLGEVSQEKGRIETVFTLTNEGSDTLVIKGMDTSCMCTTAQIINQGKEGPIYGMAMHGNPKGWSTKIEPGENAILQVQYDPNAHRELRGPVTRMINIFSNAGSQQLRINLNQVD